MSHHTNINGCIKQYEKMVFFCASHSRFGYPWNDTSKWSNPILRGWWKIIFIFYFLLFTLDETKLSLVLNSMTQSGDRWPAGIGTRSTPQTPLVNPTVPGYGFLGCDWFCLALTEYGNKLVLGLRNFPLDPYIIWKLQSWGFRIHRRSFAERLWSAFRTGRNIMAQPQNFAGPQGCDIADSSGPLIKKRVFWMPKWENFI